MIKLQPAKSLGFLMMKNYMEQLANEANNILFNFIPINKKYLAKRIT